MSNECTCLVPLDWYEFAKSQLGTGDYWDDFLCSDPDEQEKLIVKFDFTNGYQNDVYLLKTEWNDLELHKKIVRRILGKYGYMVTTYQLLIN